MVTPSTPMNVEIGQKLEIRGRYFLRGRNKNTVVFKRDRRQGRLRQGRRSARPSCCASPCPRSSRTSSRSGRRSSADPLPHPRARQEVRQAASPRLSQARPWSAPSCRRRPRRTPPPAANTADGDCDGDGIVNCNGADDDNDGDLTRSRTASTRRCSRSTADVDPLMTPEADSDGDGVEDGYEYQSARDLNDDEYQSPDTYLPVPGKRRTRTRCSPTRTSTTTATR